MVPERYAWLLAMTVAALGCRKVEPSAGPPDSSDSEPQGSDADGGAEPPPALDVEQYCELRERAADDAADEARKILAERDPSIYEARVLWYTTHGPEGRDPRLAALLRESGISAQDVERFMKTNAAGAARCRDRYEARLALNEELFPRIEALTTQRPSFVRSAPSQCLPVDQLRRPVVVYDVETGNCGRTLAVDGKGGLWTEGGCENGAPPVCRSEQLTAKGMARYRGALARLRRAHLGAGDGGAPDCSGATPEVFHLTAGARARTFELREASGASRVWGLCPGANLPRVFQDVLDVVE